jgi:hypothetical protein
MQTRMPRRKTFVVTDVQGPSSAPIPKTHMQFLRTADPALITDRHRLVQYVCQLQGCVKMLEEQAYGICSLESKTRHGV